MTQPSCPVCLGSRLDRLYPLDARDHRGERFWIVKCRSCGLQMLDPVPGGDDLAEAQDEDYFAAYSSPAATQIKARDLDRMLRRVSIAPGDRVLEVGCAAGAGIGHLLAAGYDAYGVELSELAGAIALGAYPGRVVIGDFGDQAPEGPFALLLMVDVIEHVPDPVATLARAHGLLAPGGSLLIVTPNAGSRLRRAMGRRWIGYYLAHLNCFTPEALRVASTRAGLVLDSVERFTKTVTFGYFADKASYRFPALRGLRRLDSPKLDRVQFRISDDSMLAVLSRPEADQ